MDPQGIGVSTTVMIPYLQSFAPYQGNDNSVGDGLNFVGYRFNGPVAIDTNWYIARADYKLTSNGNHTIFWRGALRNDTETRVPYLPGGNPRRKSTTARVIPWVTPRCCGQLRQQFPIRLHAAKFRSNRKSDGQHYFLPRPERQQYTNDNQITRCRSKISWMTFPGSRASTLSSLRKHQPHAESAAEQLQLVHLCFR